MASMLFRKSEHYKKKLFRVGKALRQFSTISGEDSIISLGREIEALEELSLSSYSLMKALKKELEVAAGKTSEIKRCACSPAFCIRPELISFKCFCSCHNDKYNCLITKG